MKEFKITSSDLKLYIDSKEVGVLTFAIKDKCLVAEKLFIKEEFRGQGMAKKVVEKFIEYAQINKYKIIANCSYVEHFLQDNFQKYGNLLWEG